MLIFTTSNGIHGTIPPTIIESTRLNMLDELQNKLGYHFKNIELLKRALDRRAYKAKNGKKTNHFEHLEFLGDRVLNLCIATILTQLHPEWTPSQLQGVYVHYTRNTDDSSKNGGPLYRIAKDLDIESNLRLEKGASLSATGHRGKSTKKYAKTREGALSDHMEAIISAIYTDSNYDMQILISIISQLFKPLGLLDVDHISVSNFGESLPDEDEEIVEQFIKLISTGNLPDLMKIQPAEINAKTAAYGLLVASTNKRNNIIPYLVKHYEIDLETIVDELEDQDLSISIRGFLKNFLIDKFLEINEKNQLTDIDKDTLFLLLSQQGKIKKLTDANLVVTPEIATEGLLLAIQENKSNVMIYIIKNYTIETNVLQDAFDNPSIDADTKRFLAKKIKMNTGDVFPQNTNEVVDPVPPQDVSGTPVATTTPAVNRAGFFTDVHVVHANKKEDSSYCCVIN